MNHEMGKDDFEGFLIAGNRTVYCPYHGMNGCRCGLWCSMAEIEVSSRDFTFFVCHAFKTKYMLKCDDGGIK